MFTVILLLMSLSSKKELVGDINNNLDLDDTSIETGIINNNSSKNLNINTNSNNNEYLKQNPISSNTMEWHYSFEKILSELADEAQIYSYLHKKAYEMFSYRNIKYQLPVIILSAISGSGNFISTNFPEHTKYIIIGIGCMSIITSIISSVAQFLKLSQLSEAHRISSLSWEKFHNLIKFQLRRKRKDRENIKEFFNIIISDYQRLKEMSPPIPESINKLVKSKSNLNSMKIPFIINGFHPMQPYLKSEEYSEEKEYEAIIKTDDDLRKLNNQWLNLESDNKYSPNTNMFKNDNVINKNNRKRKKKQDNIELTEI